MNKRVYMDNAATTQVSDEVLSYMAPFWGKEYGNPSAIYDLGTENKKVLQNARKSIAFALSCEPQNIYFTSGGTESDNWALIGIAEQREKEGRHIITSKIEHHAILHTCEYLEKRGFEITYLDVNEQGVVEPERLFRALRKDTILVSVMTANNEIGSIQPIAKIGEMLRHRPAVFHTDAVQAFGHIPLYPEEWGVDLLSASSHKFYGPKGAGFLYVRQGIRLPSFLHGGGQERGMRAGTENVPAIAGMGKAAEIAGKTMRERQEKEIRLRNYMIRRIESEIPYCRLNGSRKNRLSNNINFSFSFVEGETIVLLLDMEGICASSGSACTAGQAVSSHVLLGIGLPDDLARGTVRFTISDSTTKEDVDYTVDKLKMILEKNRGMNPAYQSFLKRNQRR